MHDRGSCNWQLARLKIVAVCLWGLSGYLLVTQKSTELSKATCRAGPCPGPHCLFSEAAAISTAIPGPKIGHRANRG